MTDTTAISEVDLIVNGGSIVTMNAERQILQDSAIAVRGQTIVAVGKKEQIARDYRAKRTIDARKDIVTPGFIDGHNHPIHFMSKGSIDDLESTYRQKNIIVPYEKAISADETYLNSLSTFTEMIMNGTTCFNDPGTLNGGSVARAVEESGIRGIITHYTTDQPRYSTTNDLKDKWQEPVAKAEQLIETWNGKANGRLRVWYSIFTPDTASDALCIAVRDRAQARNIGIHAHLRVAHTDFKRPGFRSPVRRYHELGLLAPNLYLAHLGSIVDEDIELMVRHDVKGVVCLSRSMFGSGGYIAHGTIPEMVAAGMTIGLGSDAGAVSRFLDMVRQMYIAATGYKDARVDPLAIGAYKAFEMTTIDSARGLQWDDEIGSLEPGKKADIVIINTSAPEMHPHPLRNPVQNLVYTGTGAMTKTVIIDGTVVMEDRVLKNVDLPKLLEEIGIATDLLMNRIGVTVKPQWPVM